MDIQEAINYLEDKIYAMESWNMELLIVEEQKRIIKTPKKQYLPYTETDIDAIKTLIMNLRYAITRDKIKIEISKREKLLCFCEDGCYNSWTPSEKEVKRRVLNTEINILKELLNG